MDALERDDIEEARRKTPEEKFLELVDTVETGMRLKRASLRAKNPGLTDEQIEELFDQWLGSE